MRGATAEIAATFMGKVHWTLVASGNLVLFPLPSLAFSMRKACGCFSVQSMIGLLSTYVCCRLAVRHIESVLLGIWMMTQAKRLVYSWAQTSQGMLTVVVPWYSTPLEQARMLYSEILNISRPARTFHRIHVLYAPDCGAIFCPARKVDTRFTSYAAKHLWECLFYVL